MHNSELGEGHSKSEPVVPAGAQPVVGRRGLAVMLGGLSLLGPLSIDAYLPAFADIQRDFQASTADLQLTLTGYLLAFACMSLVHGPLSDAFGRRRVILSALMLIRVSLLLTARESPGAKRTAPKGWLSLAVPTFLVVHETKYAREFIEAEVASFSFSARRVRFRRASESKRYTHLLPRSMFCKLDIRPSSLVAPSQLSGARSGLGRSSDTSLRYKEAKLHSRVFVDEQHGGVIGCVTFFYDVGWNGFPLAIFQVLPLV